MMNNITIRYATPDDAEFIAINVLDAIGLYAPSKEMVGNLAGICRREDTLYSWKRTCIASVNGEKAGSLTAYDGGLYHKMREITFPLFIDFTGDDFSNMIDECCSGEFYMDSLAVRPQFRQQGVATALLKNAIDIASNTEGIKMTTLAVDPDNPKALKLYRSLGYRETGDLFIFNHTYWRMELDLGK